MNQNFKITTVKRLKSKPITLIAIIFISFTVLSALFAYILAPDNSTNANRMILELEAKPIGYAHKVLKVPKQKQTPEVSLWERMIYGRTDNFNYIPINSYYFKDTQLYVQHYIDEGLSDTLSFNFNTLLPLNKKHSNSYNVQKLQIQNEYITIITYYLGSDRYGRDILSRLLIGSRVSILVGIVAVVLSIFIGLFMGSIAGYFGSWVDDIIMFVINVFWSIPTILLVFALTITFGKGFFEIFIAIGLTMWVGAARIIRGQVLELREKDFIKASQAIGANSFRIISKHIVPNIVGPIIVIATNNFAAAILIEAGLSFLGIGIQPPQPSWGLMIKEQYNFLITNQPMAAIIPGLAIMLLVYAFNIVGNTLRDFFDVRM